MRFSNQCAAPLQSLFAEIVLDESIRLYKKQVLYLQIDHALENRDKKQFQQLAKELNMILFQSIS